MTYAIIIPARYASTRFPGKPLAMLGTKPIIAHVIHQASLTGFPVYVATDDMRIAAVAEQYGAIATLTRSTHRSGTDRLSEAVENLKIQADVIINVQGDEPFISPDQIKALTKCFEQWPDTRIATLAQRPLPEYGYEELEDASKVKVVTDLENRALYFSRSIIPFVRGIEHEKWIETHPYLLHIGIYAYRREELLHITTLPPTSLEIAENLEQLRWLQNGIDIRVAISKSCNIGIDTPADLERARIHLQQMNNI